MEICNLVSGRMKKHEPMIKVKTAPFFCLLVCPFLLLCFFSNNS